MDSISFSHTFFSNHISLGLSLPTAHTHTCHLFAGLCFLATHSQYFRWMMIMILEWECFKWILPNERVQMDASMLTTVFMWDFLKIIFNSSNFISKLKCSNIISALILWKAFEIIYKLIVLSHGTFDSVRKTTFPHCFEGIVTWIRIIDDFSFMLQFYFRIFVYT